MTWLQDWTRGHDPEVRLLCLAPAGGGAHLYRRWPALLPATIGVLAVELPGHGRRMAEPLVDTITGLLGPLRRALLPLLDRPLVVFGHSMGSTIGAELCRAIRAIEPDWRPAIFVAAAAEAPDVVAARNFTFRSSDTELLAYLHEMGGTPPELLKHPEYLQLLLPILRADLAVLESTGRGGTSDRPALDCPVRLYLGDDDDSVQPDRLYRWTREARGEPTIHHFTGGHFFVSDLTTDVLRTLRRDISSLPRELVPTRQEGV